MKHSAVDLEANLNAALASGAIVPDRWMSRVDFLTALGYSGKALHQVTQVTRVRFALSEKCIPWKFEERGKSRHQPREIRVYPAPERAGRRQPVRFSTPTERDLAKWRKQALLLSDTPEE